MSFRTDVDGQTELTGHALDQLDLAVAAVMASTAFSSAIKTALQAANQQIRDCSAGTRELLADHFGCTPQQIGPNYVPPPGGTGCTPRHYND